MVLFLACTAISERRTRGVSEAVRSVQAQGWNILLGIIAFLLTMVPFVVIYLPVLHRTGKRHFGETLYYMPGALGIFDVGRQNLLWGHVAGKIEDFMSPGGMHEHPAGWPLLTIAMFLGSSIYCGIQLWRSRGENRSAEKQRPCLVAATALTCLTLLWAGIKLGSRMTAWAVLWKLVPGAAAIRVPQRIDLVLNLGVVIVCMFGFEKLMSAASGRGMRAYAIPALLACLLLVEQLNFMPTHLISRADEQRKFARIPPPPKACAEFYASNWRDSPPEMFVVQTDAMLVAQQYGIPTLNGYSGWFPDGWDLMTAGKGRVAEEAEKWARLHGVSAGLCSLDIDSGAWSPVIPQLHD